MGCEVSMDDNTLTALANKALDKGLGARWLNSQPHNMLDEQIYEKPDAERFLLGSAAFATDNIRSD